MSIHEIGGTLSILVLIHLFADWVIQTDFVAKRKSDESPWLLVFHGFTYSLMFLPIIVYSFNYSVSLILSSYLILFVSHCAIDTYVFVWVWARFIRKPPEMDDNPVKGFTEWTSQPYGMMLSFGIDQLMHMIFLVSISVLISLHKQDEELSKFISYLIFSATIGAAVFSIAIISFLWKKTSIEDDEDGEYDRPSMPSQHDE